MYQGRTDPLLRDMHLITPGVAASLTPTSLEPARAGARARTRTRGRLHLPHLRLHLPHLHLPHRHA